MNVKMIVLSEKKSAKNTYCVIPYFNIDYKIL